MVLRIFNSLYGVKSLVLFEYTSGSRTYFTKLSRSFSWAAEIALKTVCFGGSMVALATAVVQHRSMAIIKVLMVYFLLGRVGYPQMAGCAFFVVS